MTTAIQPTRSQGATLWNSADEALVRSKCAPKATPEEWKLFLYMANRYELDPLLGQIYCVKYGDNPAAIYASRDGFLIIAQRGNRLNGMQTTCRVEEVPFTVTYYDASTRQRVEYSKPTQIVATSTVWGKGMDHPIVVEVWEEEYSTGRNLWVTKRRTMTAKVAECQALRRLGGISGLYDRDEMGNDAVRADVMDVEAREVDSQTGEITGAPLKQAPQRTERPATVSGVQSPASAPAPAPAARMVAPVTRGTKVVVGSEIESELVGQEIRRIRDSFSWTNAELLKVARAHVNPDLPKLADATPEECQRLLDVLKDKDLAALPEYASIVARPVGAV